MSKKNSLIQKITDYKVIIAIQIIASLIIIGLVFKLAALPFKYLMIVIALVALLAIGTFFLMKPSKHKGKGKVRNVIGKIISILLSILLLVGSLYIAQGDSTIASITGANTQTTRYSVYVMKDSSAEKLSDLKGQTIEVNTQVETQNMNRAIENMLKEESSLSTKDVNDYNVLVDDLYNGQTKAIYMNEAYKAVAEAVHENFDNETKVIYTYEFEEKVVDFSAKVNVTEEPFIIYISGIDTYGKVSTVSRSDVNMMVTVNPKTKQILMTSIPRDYFVKLANRGEKDKLTHSGLAGVENTVKTVEGFMGVPINYYARVNFTSLIKIVDALGGVDVDSPTAFRAASGDSFKKGINHVNGKQALAFSRERYAFGGGDGVRVANQQRVLTAMLRKMMSPAIITNYSKVLKSIDGSFETNMKSSDITDLIQMQINDMASWTFSTKQLNGTGKMMTGGSYMPKHKLYYLVPSDKSIQENKAAIQKVLNGETVQ